MATAPRRRSSRILSCFLPPQDVQEILAEVRRCEDPIYGVFPFTDMNIGLLEQNGYAVFKRYTQKSWSEQNALVKVSDEKTIPLEFHSSLKYMMDLGDRLTAVFKGLYAERFLFMVEQEATSLFDAGASVKAVEQLNADVTARSTKERTILSERSWNGDPSCPFVAVALDNPVLEELGIVQGVRRLVEIFENSSEWDSKEFNDSKSLDLKVGKEARIRVGMDGVAVSANCARTCSDKYFWELKVTFFASSKLTPDKQWINKGLEKPYWAVVDNSLVVLSKLYMEREGQCTRNSCKTSILWSLQIAEGGWKTSAFRLRPPIYGDAKQSCTVAPNELELQARKDSLFCQVCDLPGVDDDVPGHRVAPAEMMLAPHQFVVLVIEAQHLFYEDGTVVNDVQDVLGSFPHLKDAVMILLTKWDIVLCNDPLPSDAAGLASRLDNMWADQEMINIMNQCCARLREKLGGDSSPSIRYHRTPIDTGSPPSRETVQAIQKMTVEMLGEFLDRVSGRLRLVLGVNRIHL